MGIASLKIENFRCFKSLDLTFSKTHALVGENACGKTAILEAIALATSGGQPHISEQDFNNGDVGNLIIEVTFEKPFLVRLPDGYTTQDIPCKQILLEAHRREKASPGKALSDPFVIERYAIPIIYNSSSILVINTPNLKVNIPKEVKKTTNGYESPRQSGSPFKFTTNRLTLQNDTVNLPDVFYFNRERENQARVGFNSLLTKIAKDLNWRYRKGWDQTKINDEWKEFYRSVITTVDSPKSDRIMEPLRKKIEKVTGNNFSDLELGILDIEQPFSKTFFSRRDGTNQIEHSRFGSGISILLSYFLLDIISNLSKNEVVFLIDEPELHLHPQLQYALLKEFYSSNSQTIYTTHSDCLINIGNWESISRLNSSFEAFPTEIDLIYTLDGKPIRDHLDDIKKWHQYESIFFREDNQIFFAKKCLLVEGPSEKYGIPSLAQKLKLGLDGITIISCNGKSKIHYYQLLCKAFNIPYYTLFDLDNKPDSDTENKLLIDCSIPGAYSHFTVSFENEFGISSNRSHKSSELLTLIDSISTSNIPVEVKTIITSISDWSK